MVSNFKPKKYSCPFCGNKLNSRFTKCFNFYCQGQKFNVGNLVIFRLNPKLGIGRIVKALQIPTSKSLDEEDTSFITKYKVIFKDNTVKIVLPIDLIHYLFEVNDKIETKQGIGIINSKDFYFKDGILSYKLLKQDGKSIQIYESEIYSKYFVPLEKLLISREIDPPRNFLIKYWANLFYSYYTSFQIKCITNSRLSLMPHQINVTHRLSEEFFPRVILADEVGLGKTIEAGIYIKEMMARNLAERVLIIVPASLVKQWTFEMSNKFNVDFTIYDGKKIKELRREGDYRLAELLKNPFYYDNLIICSLQFARNRKYIELLSQISWDIVIFDEAHHLRRYLINSTTGSYRETLNYELARKLSANSESMLLLTATPLQLHSFELFSLIELTHPEIFESFSEFEHFRKNMPFINLIITNLNQIERLNNFEVKTTVKLLKDLEYVNKKMNNEQILLKLRNEDFKKSIIKNLEEDHTLSNFLIRNRKKNVFTEELLSKRIVNTIMVNPTKEELEIYNEIRLYLAKIYNTATSKENVGLGFVITTLQKLLTSSKYAFLKSLERRLEQIERYKDIFLKIKENDPEYFELELEEESLDTETFNEIEGELSKKQLEKNHDIFNQEKILKEFYNKLKNIPYDSKSEKLLEIISQIYSRNQNEKIIIFTQFVDTLLFLKELLEKQKENYFVETFYGSLDKDQKDQAVNKFRNSKKFSILLSTEIGGEGRNFQFCRILINYDLPWNPMKLEQRIGRLDRIGQESQEIFIYNFFMEGTVETDVVYALIKRINLFEESIGVLEPIIGRIEKDLKNVIFAEDDRKKRTRLNEFYRTLDEEIQRAKEIEMQLDDLMIDKKSFQMVSLLDSLASCIDVKLSHNELFLLVNSFFKLESDIYGYLEKIDSENIDSNLIFKIKIKNILLKNPKYKIFDNYTGTFNLDLAREKEEIDFFALGHPLVNSIIDFCIGDTFKGSFTVLNIKKELLSRKYNLELEQQEYLYLLIFSVKFQGYIIEHQFFSIIVDKNGNEIENLAEFVLNIENYEYLFKFSEYVKNFNIDDNLFNNIRQKAKKVVKFRSTNWKKEVKRLNDKIYFLERSKKEKIYEYNRRALNLKIEQLKRRIEKQKNRRPSKRQLQNIEKITDKKRKKERMDSIQQLEEDIKFLEKDLQVTEKKIDDLAFEFEDMKNEMIRKNLAKFYTNLSSIALINLVD
ncbi:MAG: SNF2-related protein [Promethearchaeota archaeon]